MDKIVMVSASRIEIPEVKLRGKVTFKEGSTQESKWKSFVNSIESIGYLSPVAVMPYTSDDGRFDYTLVDGVQRVSAGIEIAERKGEETMVPCIVGTDERAMVRSITANEQRFATRRGDIAKQIEQWHTRDGLTLAEICDNLSMPENRVLSYLSLNALDNVDVSEDKTVLDLVNDQSITLGNALTLVKVLRKPLTDSQIASLVNDAQEQKADAFGKTCQLIIDGFKAPKMTLDELADLPYEHHERFSRERLNVAWDSAKERYADSLALNEPMTEQEENEYTILSHIFCCSVLDIEEGAAQHKATIDAKIEKAAKAAQEREDKKAE